MLFKVELVYFWSRVFGIGGSKIKKSYDNYIKEYKGWY